MTDFALTKWVRFRSAEGEGEARIVDFKPRDSNALWPK